MLRNYKAFNVPVVWLEIIKIAGMEAQSAAALNNIGFNVGVGIT
ncbi:hypothetical protein [Niastella populi]|nr:hypothetical protein [Niastella populi]